MATCKQCGKKSIFMKVNKDGLCINCERLNDRKRTLEFEKEIKKMKEENKRIDDEFNRQITILNDAREKYKQDKDINALINSFESVLLYEKLEWNPVKHLGYLAEYYMKAEMYDKAWGLLNDMYLKFPENKSFIRELQAKLLKKEKRYAYSIQMQLLSTCLIYDKEYPNWFEKSLLKLSKELDIQGKKLNMDEETKVQILNIARESIKELPVSESKVVSEYKKLVQNIE